jgi:hypothetical protein
MSGMLDGWTPPTDEQIAEGVAELGKIIGETEAAKPSWVRRLVLFNGEWRVLVNTCVELQPGQAAWSQANATTRIPAAFPLKEGADLLAGEKNPESELARRDQAVRQHMKQLADEEEAKRKREAELATAKKQAELDRVEFKWDKWERLQTWQQFAHLLALSIEGFYPDLAHELHRIALMPTAFAGQDSKLPSPSAKWWGGGTLLG